MPAAVLSASGNHFMRLSEDLTRPCPIMHDTDYCFKIQLKEWNCILFPEAVVHIRCRCTLMGLLRQACHWAEYNVLLYKMYRPRNSKDFSASLERLFGRVEGSFAFHASDALVGEPLRLDGFGGLAGNSAYFWEASSTMYRQFEPARP